MANSTAYNFPDQSIPEIKKTKEWHIDHVRNYISAMSSSGYGDNQDEIESMYRSYLCMMNKEEQALSDPVTKPYGSSLGVDYIVYNLVEQKIEQLIGDYMDRVVKRKSYVMNKEAQNRKLDAKVEMISESIFRELNEKFQQENDIELETENPEMEIPESVEEFFNKTYKDIAEEITDDLMEKFLDVDKQKREIIPTLRDWLIADQAHLAIYVQNGIVKWRKAHPLEVKTDKDPHKEIQDDHEYFIENVYMAENEIYNEFELDDKQKGTLKNDFLLLQNFNNGRQSSSASTWVNDRGYYVEENGTFRLCVVKMTWKSRKDLRVKISDNKKTGSKIYKKLSDKDKTKKTDKLLVKTLETERHCMMIGHNICLSYGIAEKRNYRISDVKKNYLNFVSVYRQNSLGMSTIRSVPAKLHKLQEWASEQLFELRLASRRNQGKVMVYDTAQIPSQYLKGDSSSAYGSALNRVMHHVKKDQFIFMNSKERNNRFNFNQFTSVDMSTTGWINDILAGLAVIEDLADKMVGLTPGRQGQSGQYTTATNVESQRQSSFSRTEVFYRPFDDFLQTAMERVTMLSQKNYADGELIHYVIGDEKTKFIKIMPEWSQTDLGWYLSDGGKDAKKKQIIDQAAQLALGNAQTEQMILSLIDVLSADTAVESKAILQRAVTASEKLAQQNAEAAQAQAQAQLDQKAQAESGKADLTREGYDNNIDVAKVYAKEQRDKSNKEQRNKAIENLAKFEQDNIKKLEGQQ